MGAQADGQLKIHKKSGGMKGSALNMDKKTGKSQIFVVRVGLG